MSDELQMWTAVTAYLISIAGLLWLARWAWKWGAIVIPVEVRALIWTAPLWMFGVARKPWPDGFGVTIRCGKIRAVITTKRWWEQR